MRGVARERWIDRLGPNGPWLALVVTCFVGWGFKAHCGAAWTGAEQYVTGCYSDVVPFWGVRGVSAGQVPYFQARLEYPVLTGALIWLEGLVARLAGGAGADAATFLNVATLGNAMLAGVILALMREAGVGLVRQYAWALAPPLVLYLGHNWDLLAAAFAVAALLAARRGAGVAAGALAALGGAAKLFPVLLLPLLGLQALLARGRPAMDRIVAAGALALVAVAAWGAVNLPVALLAPDNWREFYAFSGARGGTAASVWELLAQFGWWRGEVAARNLWSFVAFVAGAVAIVAVGWRRHRAQPWLLFTPALAWFLLTSKVYSPQFDLWLWPLLVLTATRARPMILFLVGDLLAYFAEFWMFAGMEGAHPSATISDVAAAAIVRAVAMLWLIHAAVRDAAPAWASDRVTPPPAAAPHRPGLPTPAGSPPARSS